MADLDDVVTALATKVATVTSLAGRTYPYGKDFVDTPGAIVVPSTGDFWFPDDSSSGTNTYIIVVKVMVGAADDRTGQALLQSYLTRTGSNSIREKVPPNSTLGGVVDSTSLTSVRAYGEVEWANMIYYGAELVYEIMA